MNIKAIAKILIVILGIISAFMLIPLGISLYLQESGTAGAFIITMAFSFFLAGVLYLSTFKLKEKRFRTKDGFVMVVLSWIIASIIIALPYIISKAIPGHADAFFEAMSGLTTTGSTILEDVEALPKSLLMWRALSHWLGGMGIIVLTIAVLPLLGISGFSLMQAEAPGPTIEKIAPKIRGTAKILWIIYISLTIAEIVLLKMAGMGIFDSIVHSFSTISTGGFSTRNSSIADYNSTAIPIIITVFMILSGINFALYFRLFTGNFLEVWKNTELKYYFSIMLVIIILIAINLKGNIYGSFGTGLKHSSFQVASTMSTTGFTITDYQLWPAFSQALLFLLFFVGGSAGSTAGGVKVIRIVALSKLAINELKKIIYPKAIFTIKINKKPIEESYLNKIGSFFFIYIGFVLLTTIVVSTSGTDLLNSFATALATLGNVGSSLGQIGLSGNYAHFSAPIKYFLSLAMLIGRLEFYTVLVILLPRFWKK